MCGRRDVVCIAESQREHLPLNGPGALASLPVHLGYGHRKQLSQLQRTHTVPGVRADLNAAEVIRVKAIFKLTRAPHSPRDVIEGS